MRDDDPRSLRDYLIATAARLIAERGSAGLAVRDIAREAQVADGVLYNYFEDKEDLLAHALLAHVGSVMQALPPMPPAGTGTVPGNLTSFIDLGITALTRVGPAFAGLLAQPRVLSRFHAMVGGDAAFGTGAPDDAPADEDAPADQDGPADEDAPADRGGEGLPAMLSSYLLAEQRLGRIDQATDVDAATTLVVGAIHGQVLPRVLFSPPGEPLTTPPGLAARLARLVLRGIAPQDQPGPAAR